MKKLLLVFAMVVFAVFPLMARNTYPGATYPGATYPGATYPGATYPTDTYPQADQFAQAVDKAINKVSPTSTNAHNEGVVDIVFHVDSEFSEYYSQVNHLEKECVAVRIADQYLLASMSCIGLSPTATKLTSLGSQGYKEIPNVKVARRDITGASIEKQEIAKKDIFVDKKARLILIHWDANNEILRKKIARLPIPNLFIPQDPQSLLDTFPKVVVNRNRLIAGRTCAEVDVARVCSEKSCFEVCWKLISAQTGSPLFGLPDDSNQEFLLGFNAAEPDKGDRQSGEKYYLLTEEAVDFFKAHMDATTFNKLNRKIVDENFFK